MTRTRIARGLALAAAVLACTGVSPALYRDLHWRFIGPLRGGRTTSITGVAGHPNRFYIGVVNGGVWKSDDAGRTWQPIFDSQPTGSIGALAVAPSDPNVVYAGSGEGLQRPDLAIGDGIYKSADAGATWTHLGLRDGQQIPAIAVDPKNPDRLFVAVLGHPFGPNDERGVYRSLDGGATFAACSSKMKTLARTTSCSIRTTPTSSTRRCGRRAKPRGKSAARSKFPGAASTSPPTAERRGRN